MTYLLWLNQALELLDLEPHLRKASPEQVQDYFDEKWNTPWSRQAVDFHGTQEPGDIPLSVSKGHVREAWIRYWNIRHAMRNKIPDGWTAEQIVKQMVPLAEDPVIPLIDSWLADFPEHPLADYVRLHALRVYYLRGETELAWSILLDVYSRRPVRAVGEMRFLLLQGLEPNHLKGDQLPPELLAALLPYISKSAGDWHDWWALAKENRGEPWATALAERMLIQQFRDPTLPELDTPIEPLGHRWTKLLFLVEASRGHRERARELGAQLKTDFEVSSVLSHLAMEEGDWKSAIEQPGLEVPSRNYLIRVLAPEAALLQLIDSDDASIRLESRIALATRRAQEGDWKAGAKLLKRDDPQRYALWKHAEGLSRKTTPEARLGYAIFLHQNAGNLFYPRDYEEIVWYRSLHSHGDMSPELESWLTRSFEEFYALRAYATVLEATDPKAANARLILDMADRVYNKLLNFGNSHYYVWSDVIVESTEARTVRRVGRDIRRLEKER